jgi:solute:Na+ symporter, SSS family
VDNSSIIALLIFTFTFIPLIIAELARNRSLPSIEDFFVYGRKMPAFLVFFTVYATWVSAFAFLGASSYFYFRGPVYMTAFAWNILFGILFYVIGRPLWYYGKKNGYITPIDFFRDIYQSKPLNTLITAVLLIFTIPYLQIQFAGGAYLIDIASASQIPWRLSGLIFYIVMIVYLWAGGIRAVAMTDVFYGVILFIAMILAGLMLAEKAGGIEHIFATLAEEDINNVIMPGPEGHSGPALWLAMFVVTPLGALMGPPLWIRAYSVGKESTFRIMPLLLSVSAIEYLGCILAGNAGKILNPNLPENVSLIPTLLTQYGHPILVGFLFCGIAAAALSTANSQIHALSAIYTIDIHREYINPGASERKLLSVGKWAVMVFSAVAYVLMLQNPTLLISTGLLAMSGTMQIIVPTLGALYWVKSNARGAFAGIASGIIVLLVLYFGFSLDPSYCGVSGFAVNALVFILVCKASPSDPQVRNKIVKYRHEFLHRGK